MKTVLYRVPRPRATPVPRGVPIPGEWLNLARFGTASQGEKQVSKYRKTNEVEECDRALGQQGCREAVAYFDHR